MKYKGVIEKVYYSGSDWSSVRLKMTGSHKNLGHMTAAGKISFPIEGYDIELEGTIVINPKYGEQINVISSTIKKSRSEYGIKTFLKSGFVKGIGPATAEAIYSKFGKDTMKIFQETPERLVEVKGISQKKLETIILPSYNENQIYQGIYTELKGKISMSQAKRIYDRYKDESLNKIKKNPYILMYQIDGIGFLKADAIAKTMGVKDNDGERVHAALVYTLKTMSSNSGHCYSDVKTIEDTCLDFLTPFPKITENKTFQKEIESKIKSNIDGEASDINKIYTDYNIVGTEKKKLNSWIKTSKEFLELMAQSLVTEADLPDEEKNIVIEFSHDDYAGERIYLKNLYDAENDCATIISKLVKSKPVKKVSLEEIYARIVDFERKGMKLGEEQIEAVKTSLSNRISIITGGPGRGKTTIVKLIMESWNNDRTIVLCAPTGRAAQRMKETTGHNASTIQRLTFESKSCPIKNALIIVDEASMLDIELASKTLKFAEDCNIVFVGDVDQLPSVGPGSFFRHIIECKMVPTTVLKTGYRNEGSIAKNAELINTGASMKLWNFDKDFEFIDSDKEHIQNNLLKLYKKYSEEYEQKEIAILSPMKKRSQSGSLAVNKLIKEEIMNEKGNVFSVHDRVMCIKNNARKEVIKNGKVEMGVYNGDCGEITKIDDVDNIITILFDDDRIGNFTFQEMENFELAFAITIHKSQGSEYRLVIIPMNVEHYIMLQRNLLYTAVTRAKEKVILIGDKKAFSIAIRNTDYKERNSMLKQRIIKLVNTKS